MKLALAFLGLLLALAAPSSAADTRPYTKPAPYAAPAPYDWSGVYIGASAGYATGKVNGRPVKGAVFGSYIGAQKQFGHVVLGVEAAGSYGSGVKGGNTAANSAIDATGALKARAGLAFDRFLVYGVGGVAGVATTDKTYAAGPPPVSTSHSTISAGYLYGGGVEYAFTDHLSARAEYNHVNAGGTSADVFLGGLSFKF